MNVFCSFCTKYHLHNAAENISEKFAYQAEIRRATSSVFRKMAFRRILFTNPIFPHSIIVVKPKWTQQHESNSDYTIGHFICIDKNCNFQNICSEYLFPYLSLQLFTCNRLLSKSRLAALAALTALRHLAIKYALSLTAIPPIPQEDAEIPQYSAWKICCIYAKREVSPF